MTYKRNPNEHEKYGFIYIWYDRKLKMYYIGSHWGTVDDGYICSSNWMRPAHFRRPEDFRRRIIKNHISTREETYMWEQHYLDMININEIRPYTKSPRYYNLSLSAKEPWYKTEEQIKVVGAKISAAKKGKSTGPRDPSIGAAISAAKKGKKFSEKHKQALREAKLGTTRSEEAKRKTSESLRENWANSTTRPRRMPKQTMTREQQDQATSERLKSKWADPVWAANQKEKLRQGAQKRWNHK